MEGVKKKADGTGPLTSHMKAVDGLNQTIKRREKEIIRLESENESLKKRVADMESFFETSNELILEDGEG